MNWKNAKVLVTGANGFIGSHLSEHLVNLGAKITVLLEYNPNNHLGHLKFLQKNMLSEVEQILGDIRDPELVKQIVKGKDTIFHLGALVSIPYSFVNPREVFEVNAEGTLNILLAARDQEVSKIVTTSTSEVYGTALYTPIDENHPLQAQSPYAASKIAADKIAESFYKTYNLPVATIRPFNTYGPRQSDRAIIPTIISQALKKSFISIGSTTPRRDLSYVSDTVNGFIKIAESKKSVGQVINIGLGEDISIGELIKMILLIMNKDMEIVSAEKRKRPEKSEVMRLLCDNRKAEEIVEWKPKVSLKEGLSMTIEWIKNNPDYYNPDKYQI
jgi:NAD dependent epimerase/dehydratase